MWSPIRPRSLTTSTAAGLSEPASRLLKKPAVAAGFFVLQVAKYVDLK